MGDGSGEAIGEEVVVVVPAPVVFGRLDEAAAPPQIAPTMRHTIPTTMVRPQPPEDFTGTDGG